MTVFTIGHSTRSIEAFLALLRNAEIDSVVDVRRFPGSRRNPQFNAEALSGSLAGAGIAYHPMPQLGGRRGKSAADAASPHTLWREEAFRNYADYAETPEFRAGFEALLAIAEKEEPAILCAEAVWWRCHRRIIADYLIAANVGVRHILDAGKIEPAELTPGAVIRPDGSLLYRAATLL
ncbi:MAG TPA: DUF488 domain-containing protein [Stellaceae bacterium]|nr:DUF488 domain-containing protein [Stellaceae bacterium]